MVYDGACGRINRDEPVWIGGMDNVAALALSVRMCSFGASALSVSVDDVFNKLRLGILGRPARLERLKDTWEGGGEGVGSSISCE